MCAVRHRGGLSYAGRGSLEAAKIALYRAPFAGREDSSCGRSLLSATRLAGSAMSSVLVCSDGSLKEPVSVPFHARPGNPVSFISVAG
jgi:hypothetical protein